MWKPYDWYEEKPNTDKLIRFGFAPNPTEYCYETLILEGAFRFCVTITAVGVVSTRILDCESGEEYALAYDSSARGAYVGAVRAACEEVMQKIWHTCYDCGKDKGELVAVCEAYVGQAYGVRAEHLWDKHPTFAVFREPKDRKWFAVLMVIPRSKLGSEGNGEVEVVNLKASSDQIAEWVDNRSTFPAYHMNKNHWITVVLDGTVSQEELCARIDNSYERVVAKHSKRKTEGFADGKTGCAKSK